MSPNEETPIKPSDGNESRTDSKSSDEGPTGENETVPRRAASSTPIFVASGNPISQAADSDVESTTPGSNDSCNLDPAPASSVQIVDNRQASTRSNQPQTPGLWLAPVWEVLKLFLIPALILSACVFGIALLGVAQRSGWISSATSGGESNLIGATSEETSATSYICPMMCVPPTTKPGRCPVCAMELVPAAAGSSNGPSTKIQIDPRSRRVAGIQTVVAKTETLFREVRGVGEISYDESKLKTISAYIDGRIEKLYADYTGMEVKQGDSLALIYSPDLYAAQVSYARTLEFAEGAGDGNSRAADSNRRLLDSSRQRLIELGMTEEQIKTLERDRKPNSRLALHAPMSGTVIEKMAVAGQYIKTGTPVYKLADLSSVWLVMELFPEDARLIQLGQEVVATTQSMQGQPYVGIVEFVEPTVDPNMRTVGVRVAINNENGRLKPGEFIRATLKIPLLSKGGTAQETVVIPRNSLLSIGQTSLVYVEGKPGEFELRHVKTGPTVNGQVAVFEGLAAGENVVARSTFLLDAQMQLQGNPSLMDPDKAVAVDPKGTKLTEAEVEEIRKAMEPLSESDRALAEAQLICPVTEVRLGSMGMGTPIKLEIAGRKVFICCEACRKDWVKEPEKFFTILDDYLSGKPGSSQPSTPGANGQPNKGRGDLPQMDLPQMDLPKMDLPKMDLPQMDLPQMKLPDR